MNILMRHSSKRSPRRSVLPLLLAGALCAPLPALAQTYTQTEDITYHDNTAMWVLGQVATQTVGGVVVSATTYDTTYALPLTYRSFGKLQQTLTWDTSATVASGQRGTMKTVKDGNNRVTTVGSWKLGFPQTITFADGSSKSAVVDNLGWITSVTDELGSRTCYAYDALGRLILITQPSEVAANTCNTSTWAATTLAFEPVAGTEYGIPAGHWRQTVSTGNARTIRYFDALWRPLVTREYDAANETATKRFQRFKYHPGGALSFASYPGTSDVLTAGTWTEYDALGRVTSVAQDSELGLLTTTTQYLVGLRTRTTNPKGHQTTTTYQAFDQPGYDRPMSITHPLGAYTHITRDTFGKTTQLRRSNSVTLTGGTGINRSYTYNGNQELCRVVEPETGATLMGYDAAGNLAWSATGLASGTACDATGLTSTIQPERVARTYDARNRLVTLAFPDSRGNQAWTYTPDGLPASITTLNNEASNTVINTYSYNRRRLLTAETSRMGGWYNWSLGYGYNANGHLASQTYPTGLNVSYAPNALGQATQAGSYATGVQYHPNGAIRQFTYGNGLVHTMVQNARQLPALSTDTGGALQHEYGYDPNGNVSSILDHNDSSRNRWLAYDPLDRLTDAGSVMFGGDHWHRFTYDALDNLRSWKLGGVKDFGNYTYDANNRLTSIQNTGGSTLHTLAYDAHGNLANKGGSSHNFDYGNRLRGVSNASGYQGYAYDGHGRRVMVWTPTVSQLTMYSSGGQLLFSSRVPAAGGQTTEENVYIGGSLVAIIKHDWPSNSIISLKYQHTDALGSPVAMSDQAGVVVERTNYDPYGGAINKAVDGIGYTGHVMDPMTGLTYMQQRYYDPAIGRFLSVDPVTTNPNTGAMFNRYNYAANSPYVFVDPDGRRNGRVNPNPNFGSLTTDQKREVAKIVAKSHQMDISGENIEIAPGRGAQITANSLVLHEETFESRSELAAAI